MDMTEDDSTESHAIQMKMCPRCTTPIRLSLRYGDVIKRRLQEIEKVKEEIRVKTSRGLPNKTSLLLDRLNNLSKKFSSRNHRRSWLTLRRAAQNVKNGLMADLLENKVMLMERYCLLTTKMEAYSRKLPAESRKANVLDGKSLDIYVFAMQSRSQGFLCFENGGTGGKHLEKASKILHESWSTLSRDTR